jgi:protein O-mannosyl-transferase
MRPHRLLSSAAIVLAGVLAYASAFPGAFVFDDTPNVAENPHLDRPLSFLPGGAGYAAQPNRALTFATFALDRAVAGSDPSFHRGVNVAIHVANALLVLALVLAAFQAPRLRGSALAPGAWAVGLAAGLLFVTHPIQTQAVTYVVQRLASLATLLYLATAVLWLRWRNAREAGAGGPAPWLPFAAALVVAILATRTKEIAFTLPFALLLLEAALFEGAWGRRLAWLAPFAVTLVVIPLSTLASAAPAGTVLSDVTDATRVQTAMGRGDYLLTQLTVVARYLGLVAFPAGQSLDHDVRMRTGLGDPAVLGAAALLAALAAAGLLLLWAASARRPRPADAAARLAALGIGWFFLALSVESSVIPIVDVMFEHRVYLPFAGLSVTAGTLLALLCRRLAPGRAIPATVGAAAAAAAVLGTTTFLRNEAWASEVAIWRDAVEKAPRKARPRHNLGVALDRIGRRAEALALLQQAVAVDPRYPQGHESLGVALLHAGRTAEAEVHFRRAIELAPRFAEPWYGLGLLRFEAGRYAEAAPYFQRALERRPRYPDALANLAASWNALGRPDEAVRLLLGARDDIRAHPIARAQLALALAQRGDLAGARAEVEAIRRLSPTVAAQVQPFVESRGAAPR